MKKFILLALICCTFGISLNAQTQKGWYLIGGSIADIGGNTTEKSFNFNLTPKVAWFVRDNLAIGGQVQFGVNAGKAKKPSINYFVGPMARYYFGEDQVDIIKETRFFVEANAGLSGTNGGGSSTNGFGAGIGPGLAFFVSENVALEALAKANIVTGGGTKGVAFAPNLSLGFQIYLPTSKVRELRSQVK